MVETRSRKLPLPALRHGICRYTTFGWEFLNVQRFSCLEFRCWSIHVKLCVLETYSARNWVLKSYWHGSEPSDSIAHPYRPWAARLWTPKKKQQKTERGEFITVKKLVNATFMHCSMFISVESCVTLLFISQTIGFDVILAPVAYSNMLNTMNITIRN
jgi:hypothetical protein